MKKQAIDKTPVRLDFIQSATHLDSRNKRSDEEYYEILGDENGVFSCMKLLECEDVCSKDLPLQSKIAYLQRLMLKTAK